MKKIIYIVLIFALLLYILFFPGLAIKSAASGLSLWWNRLLPTLLPFAILSHIFVESGLILSLLPGKLAKLYPICAGFLFGFPLGSKITAQMVRCGQMDSAEGRRIFSLCNNISPIFVSGFILHTTFQKNQMTLITLIILYLPPLLLLILGELANQNKKGVQGTNATVKSQINLKIIDSGIMSGFDTLTQLGGYLMLFAIFSKMTALLPISNTYVHCLITGMTEITNGISYLASTSIPFEIKYLFMLFFTAFGGVSGIIQTASMTRGSGFPMGRYVKTKLFLGLFSLILGILYMRLIG